MGGTHKERECNNIIIQWEYMYKPIKIKWLVAFMISLNLIIPVHLCELWLVIFILAGTEPSQGELDFGIKQVFFIALHT